MEKTGNNRIEDDLVKYRVDWVLAYLLRFLVDKDEEGQRGVEH
jgi:hypothetical protein